MYRGTHLLRGLLLVAVAFSGEVQGRVGDASALLQASVGIPVQAASQPQAATEEVDDGDDILDEADAAALAEAEAAYAQDTSGAFELGSTVYVNGAQGTVVWDGRPEHEFVKLKWLSGKDKGKTSEIIQISQVKTVGPNNTEPVVLAGGRHLSKHIGSATAKKKAPKVKDFSRRRRGVIRRIMYGIKKMPMVVSIPFKGLNTGVNTITSEMTAHTGIAFNGSLTNLLKLGEGQQTLQPQADVVTVTEPPRRRVNLTEVMRNKTFKAVMKWKDNNLNPILTSFNTEIMGSGDSPAPGPVEPMDPEEGS